MISGTSYEVASETFFSTIKFLKRYDDLMKTQYCFKESFYIYGTRGSSTFPGNVVDKLNAINQIISDI